MTKPSCHLGALKGAVIASAAHRDLSTVVEAADAGHEKLRGAVKRAGINACMGTGACAGAGMRMTGPNSLQGEGWVPTQPEKDCKDKGGTVVAKN